MNPTLAQLAPLFTAPALAAAGVVAVLIPIVIHLLSRFRRTPQVWGAMRFVWEAFQKQRRRLQLEQWLLLAVRCLLVLVLGLALSGPILTGCAEQLRAAGLMQGGGRTVHLVVDDSLPAGTVDPASGDVRAERLGAIAQAVLEGVGPTDRVTVWRASRPAGEVAGGQGQDAASAREALERLVPRYTAAAWNDVLGTISEQLQGESPDRAGRAAVVLVSDFARGSVGTAEGEAPAMPGGVSVLVSRPAADAPNLQVEAVQPRRRLVVAGRDGRATVPVRVQLRRFESAERTVDSTLQVLLLDDQGRALAEAQRPIRWAQGQVEQAVNVDVALPGGHLSDDRRILIVEARLEGMPTGANALAADDRRWSTVELRQRLNVGLVAEASPGGAGGARGELSPARWAGLALSPPRELGPTEMELLRLSAAQAADPARLEGLDAVVLLRPDLLPRDGWAQLAAFAGEGGLVWVMPPAGESAGVWVPAMRDAFGLPWTVALEPQQLTPPESSDPGVTVANTPAPAVLNLLASDWEALWRPVRVARWQPVLAPAGDAWVRLDGLPGGSEGAATAGGEASALLAFAERGRGGLLLSSLALDTNWTNLPTKPVFLPLMHEAIKGVLGRPSPAGEVLVGAVAELPVGAPEEAGALRRLPVTLVPDAPERVPVGDDLLVPGVYSTAPAATQAKLAVNLPVDAGDTRAADPRALAAWLDSLGNWQFLPDDPRTALQMMQESGANLGWPLLWVVLALVLAETLLARAFSHAKDPHNRGLTLAVWERMRRVYGAPPQAEPGTAKAAAPSQRPERGRAA